MTIDNFVEELEPLIRRRIDKLNSEIGAVRSA
jgi:hypothetical protein